MPDSELAVVVAPQTFQAPILFERASASTKKKFFEFFTVPIRNANTRAAYYRAIEQFLFWCERAGYRDLEDIEPITVAAYIETLQHQAAPATVKQHMAAIRMLFSWLTEKGILAMNPAREVKTERFSRTEGKTPAFVDGEVQKLLDAIETSTHTGLRDRALLGVLAYTFDRIGEGISPIEAAKRVKVDAERDNWVPGPLQPGILCPLTDSDVMQLYACQGALTPAEDSQLSVQHPELSQLVSPADFRLLALEGRAPRTVDEFRASRAQAKLLENRQRFSAHWRRAVECLGGPAVETLGRSPERAAQSYAVEIRARLDWRTGVWEPLIGELREVGFRWEVWLGEHPPVPGDHGELARIQRAASERLAEIVEAQAALLTQKELSSTLLTQRTYLSHFPQSDAASVLLQAQDSWDVDNYEAACRELAHLEGLREVFNTRQALLSKLELFASAWARAITQRHKPHDASQPPGEPASAWRWRQWLQELERRAAVSMTNLQERLNQTEDELRRLAAQIIEHETWAAQRERTKLSAQQALMGFVQTIRKVGKGTGKRAPELLRHARQLLTYARRAVPVWIMPLNRVYESFDPRETKFDVVIIDEASQSDVTALAALYFGREHVVVGDKEQVTPDAVGQRLDHVQRLISTDLQGIPNSHLYDGQTSIYDLAETAFGGVVALREHFRCVPEIIQFSNHLSYNQTIRPLREPLSAAVRPALVAHRVNGFRDGANTNSVEAEEIASLVIACLQDPDYAQNRFGRPMSFGVISLLGIDQALLIEQHLRRRLPPDVFARHRLLCGNAAQFQGDERDVIFLSNC
jgi:hypothetical protein